MCSPFFASNTDNVETKSGQVFLFFWFVVSLILTASYTASLTSFLVDQSIQISLPGYNKEWREPDAWRSLSESVAECYEDKGKACLATSIGGNTENILKGYLQMNKTYNRNHTTNKTESPSWNHERVLNGTDGVLAWVSDETAIDYAIQSVSQKDKEMKCKWLQLGKVFAKGSVEKVAGPSLPNDVYIRLNQQLEWAKADQSLEGLKSVYFTSQRYEKEIGSSAVSFIPQSRF